MKESSRNNKAKKGAFLGVFLGLALIFSYVESLIPFYFGVPGMKLGLTNVVIVVLMYLVGPMDAIIISVLRVLLAGFMFGNAFSIVYSLAGAVLSFVVMFLMKHTGKFKVISVSIAGGISHNLGQILVAMLVVENYNLILYFPLLLVAGVITGLLIGIISQEILLRLH